MPMLRHGGGGDAHRHRLRLPVLRRSAVRSGDAGACRPFSSCVCPTGAAAGWVQASIAYSLEEAAPPSNKSRSLIATRLPELVLIEVLRVHLATAPAADHGWIAALNDPVLAPALSLVHNSPARQLDRFRSCIRCHGVPLVARRALSPDPRSLTDPVPHRVAHAPRRHPPRHDRSRRRRHRSTCRLRVGGGVQPSVQARAGAVAEPLAGEPITPPVIHRAIMCVHALRNVPTSVHSPPCNSRRWMTHRHARPIEPASRSRRAVPRSWATAPAAETLNQAKPEASRSTIDSTTGPDQRRRDRMVGAVDEWTDGR